MGGDGEMKCVKLIFRKVVNWIAVIKSGFSCYDREVGVV